MTKPLIALPCTARELETALHAVCDHGGLWDSKIYICWNQLLIETKPKGETK